MANWTLVPSLVQLRSEFNELAPNRDKASDGSIGDAAHSASVSDHNPSSDGQVHAIDVDRDLKVPGLDMEEVIQFLLARCRAGLETRLKYVIFNRRIWTASNGWRTSDYHGKNPHDHHAHFSAKYDTRSEASIASWELEDLMAIDYNKVRDIVREEIDKRLDGLVVPSADAIAQAVYRAARTAQTPLASDTAVNLSEYRITRAVAEGKVIAPYPFNKDKYVEGK